MSQILLSFNARTLDARFISIKCFPIDLTVPSQILSSFNPSLTNYMPKTFQVHYLLLSVLAQVLSQFHPKNISALVQLKNRFNDFLPSLPVLVIHISQIIFRAITDRSQFKPKVLNTAQLQLHLEYFLISASSQILLIYSSALESVRMMFLQIPRCCPCNIQNSIIS